jgi:hypothetical protein
VRAVEDRRRGGRQAGPKRTELTTRKRSSSGGACAQRPSLEELAIEDDDRQGEHEVEDRAVA